MIEIVRHTQRSVKRWQDGVRKRWTAASMLVAEQQFRRIIGYRHLAQLVIAIERHATHAATNNPGPQIPPSPLPSDRQPEDRRRSSTSEASVRQRLESVRAENQRLREENKALKAELAIAYGQQRRARDA